MLLSANNHLWEVTALQHILQINMYGKTQHFRLTLLFYTNAAQETHQSGTTNN